MELRQVEKGLAYILHVAESAVKGVDGLLSADKGARYIPGWVPIWGAQSRLAPQKSKAKRALDSFLKLIEHARVVRALCRADIGALENDLDLLMGTKQNNPEGSAFGNPGAFFRKGINKLNAPEATSAVLSTSGAANTHRQQQPSEQDITEAAGSHGVSISLDDPEVATPQDEPEVPISLDDPEVASFVMDLHIAQGAGSMFHGSFQNVKMRLQRLSKAMRVEEKCAANAKKGLDRINDHLGGAESPKELQLLAEELTSLAKEWLSTIQEQFYE